MPAIDGIAGDTGALELRLKGKEKITSRELRAIWSGRLRPFWRLHKDLYRALARRFLDMGDNYLASETADEGAQFFGDDVPLILTRALATARSGAPLAAQDLLRRKERVLDGAEESKSLLARTFKDLWKTSNEVRHLREAFELYHRDYMETKGDRTFPGVNAASMALFLGRTDDARRIAGEVLAILRARPASTEYWDRATIAECLLVSGQIDPARAAYAEAAHGGQIFHTHLATTRAQARLLLRHLGRDESEFDPCFSLPGVIAFAGHRLDAPDRAAPRFPEARVSEIKELIREKVRESGAGFGYSSAANGADILFLEVMQEAGLETYVHLPLPTEEFIRRSVEQPGSPEWPARCRAVLAAATELVCEPDENPMPFEYGNNLIFGTACQHARQLGSEVRLLVVWDERPGDGSGGTSDYVAMVREAGHAVEVIEMPGAAETHAAPRRAAADLPDKMLSMLSFSFSPEDESGGQLAAVLDASGSAHREVSDGRVRIFYEAPAVAAQAAVGIAPLLRCALGLHTGPLRFGTHPLTGARMIRGEHAAVPDALAALEPAGIIYASQAFAALLGLSPTPRVRCEFLGHRRLRPQSASEPVFQIIGS